MATRPSRASIPSTSLPGYLRQTLRSPSGSVMAEVPITSRVEAEIKQLMTDCSSRMPPPNSHSMIDRLQNRLDAGQIDRQSLAGPFQIDDVQIAGPGVGELASDSGRVVGKDGLLFVVALPQPDTLAATKVDRRPDLHDRSSVEFGFRESSKNDGAGPEAETQNMPHVTVQRQVPGMADCGRKAFRRRVLS